MLAALGCSAGGEPETARETDAGTPDPAAAAGAGADGEVTYHRDLRPLIERNCVSCHTEGGAGPFPLDHWDQVREVAPLVVAAVTTGLMPPWPASDDCRSLRDAPTLDDASRALFDRWQLAGFPEGDAADHAPATASEDTADDPGPPTWLIGAGGGYTPLPNTDEYRCFVMPDSTFEQDGYLTRMDILPGVRAQVHHAQIHRVPPGQLAAVQKLDADNEGLGYPCTAGTGVLSQNMFSYRPGSRGVGFADGDAAYVAAGSSLVIQVHYNTQFLPAGSEPLPDETRIALWMLPAGELPEHVVYRGGAIAPFTIPPGEPAYLAQSTAPMTRVSAVGGSFAMPGVFVPGQVVGVTPHAHHLASRMTATLVRADGSRECMIDVPDWDFHWQLDYLYTEGLAFGADDQLQIECQYDNSAANQAVVDGVKLEPREVTWGEGSLDEMCLHYVWMRYDREAFLAARAAAAAAAATPTMVPAGMP